MTIDLSDYETGAKFDGDYDEALEAVQERLARIQVAHIVHGRRAIIVFEGWDAAGKGGTVQRLTANWDPRYFEVWPIAAPTEEEKERHFLWRFWTRLPGRGEINIFDRSWYGRVLVERVENFATEKQWRRAYDEINEFEAQQKEDGTTIVKLFMHTTQESQDERIKKRIQHPWKRWKTGAEDFRNRARRADYLAAMADMFELTNTRWAPWQVIDGNNKKAARIAALTYIADRLEKSVPMTPPPASPELIALARSNFGADFEIS
ncbi:Polyphosphate kinase 2, PPK2 family [Sphingomonas laterariae]|uniref:Polyphosphate kinase 2, PPK2 family n=1 Tax=Edaphosphingomonas laterariae TaxID=861865 RepID=A0A239CSP4_9SPHN|nr:polyphosphate kinase [Sphingomonas laterariae]SNS23185.1 Polyphosphate kinase 2, PPK2 family [Sphingomonas laterariae]